MLEGATGAKGSMGEALSQTARTEDASGSNGPADVRLADLGHRIRALRRERSRTLSDVAGASGISTSLLSQVERGICNPSIRTMIQIADALDVEVADLFADLPPSGPVMPASRRITEPIAPGVHAAVLGRSPDDSSELAELVVEAGGRTRPRPAPHHGFEAGYVVEGAITLELGGERHDMAAGDSVSFPSSVPHRVLNEGTEPATLIWLSYGSDRSEREDS